MGHHTSELCECEALSFAAACPGTLDVLVGFYSGNSPVQFLSTKVSSCPPTLVTNMTELEGCISTLLEGGRSRDDMLVMMSASGGARAVPSWSCGLHGSSSCIPR